MSKYVVLTAYTAFNNNVEIMPPFETNKEVEKDIFVGASVENSNAILGPLTKQYDIYVYEDGRRIDHISNRFRKFDE